MLSAAQLSDIRKMIHNNKLESSQQFIDLLSEIFDARTKDPLRVEAQLHSLYYDTEGNP